MQNGRKPGKASIKDYGDIQYHFKAMGELLNICKQGNGVAIAELWNDKSRIGRVRLKGKRP